MTGVNKADAALAGSFLAFLASLYLHLQFPNALWADGLLTVSEAALVGGAADWFAPYRPHFQYADPYGACIGPYTDISRHAP